MVHYVWFIQPNPHTDALRISRKTALERDRIAFEEKATTGDESSIFKSNMTYVHTRINNKFRL